MDGFQDGKVSQLEHVFIRGSRVRFMIIPDMLKNAPMFKRLEARIRVSTLTPAPPSLLIPPLFMMPLLQFLPHLGIYHTKEILAHA